MFRDRQDAGSQLADALRHLRDRHPVVLALPRGGVPIGLEVARGLGAPLDLLLVRKVGAPGQPELAVGAVIDGERPDFVANEEVLEALGLSDDFVEQRAADAVAEIERRRSRYLGGREAAPVRDRCAVVVDDGIATGATVRAALRGVRRRQPAHLVLAVPVAPRETVDTLRKEVDELVCLQTPSPFGAVGCFYSDFSQLTDDEVLSLLERADREARTDASPAAT